MNKKINILMFSGDYDKALAALILATTARSMEINVTMFFAFWGLFILRDPEKVKTEDKTQYEKMFGMVTPKGPEDLPLSKMNMSGLGRKMLEKMMEDDDAPNLYNFLEEARQKGVQFYGCQLSMEVMGFKKDELLPEMEIMTAQNYLNNALESDIKLFI